MTTAIAQPEQTRDAQALPPKKRWFTHQEDVQLRQRIVLGSAALSMLTCIYVLIILASGHVTNNSILLKDMSLVAWSELYTPTGGWIDNEDNFAVTVSVYWYYSGWCFEQTGSRKRRCDHDEYGSIVYCDVYEGAKTPSAISAQRFAHCVGHKSTPSLDIEMAMSYIDDFVAAKDEGSLSRAFKPPYPKETFRWLLAPFIFYILYIILTVVGWVWKLAAKHWLIPWLSFGYGIAGLCHTTAAVFLAVASVLTQLIQTQADDALIKYNFMNFHTKGLAITTTTWTAFALQVIFLFLWYKTHKARRRLDNPETYRQGLPRAEDVDPPLHQRLAVARREPSQHAEPRSSIASMDELPPYTRHDESPGAVGSEEGDVEMGDLTRPTYEEAVRGVSSSSRVTLEDLGPARVRQSVDEERQVVV